LFGVALLTLLPTIFQPLKEYLVMAEGAILVASFLWLPEGIFGTAAIWFERTMRRFNGNPAAVAKPEASS
jgi:branched-chain amino acid transport system permease protein